MKIGLLAGALLAAPLLLPQSAAAQTGELWEVTTQMPGMPAGMMKPQRVCQGDDPERARAAQKDNENCKVTDKKQSASRTQITMVCKSGTMTIDQKYNAARTEFTSTMNMKGKDGDFTMNMTGKKVGACDVVAENKARDAKVDDMKKQAAAASAASAAHMKQTSDQQIKQCSVALEKMDWKGFGAHGMCYNKKAAADPNCKSMAEMNKQFPEATKACNANMGEFCKRFQTAEGFMGVRGREDAAKWCGVTIESIKTTQCPRVAKTQTPLSFLGGYCPVEAKPIAQEHCTGRDYTSRNGGKYNAFCTNYLANADFEKSGRQRPTEDRGTAASSQSADPAQPAQPASTGDQVKQGVSKGIDKLRGLFNR